MINKRIFILYKVDQQEIMQKKRKRKLSYSYGNNRENSWY